MLCFVLIYSVPLNLSYVSDLADTDTDHGKKEEIGVFGAAVLQKVNQNKR